MWSHDRPRPCRALDTLVRHLSTEIAHVHHSPPSEEFAISPTVHPSADVDSQAHLGDGTRVWHLAQVREHAVLGEGCVLSRGAYVGPSVELGDHVKVQNYALVYGPARLGRGVFVGPAVVMTNDRTPRAIAPDGSPKGADDWDPVEVIVEEGASLGADSTLVAPVHVGRWAMVGAGTLVTRDVPAFALVIGRPAQQIGWVGRSGARLVDEGNGRWRCPHDGSRYVERDGGLQEEGA